MIFELPTFELFEAAVAARWQWVAASCSTTGRNCGAVA